MVRAKGKPGAFLRTGRTPEFLSEARGWLGYSHFLLGEQTQAGKIYLDELNRSGSSGRSTPRRRAERMRRLRSLYEEASRAGASAEARFKLAEYLAGNPERLYFNDALWQGFQRYALVAESDSRLNRQERRRLLAAERKLKDDQEELWRAYLILREVVREAGATDLGQRAARLGVRCLRRISSRFGREKEIRAADLELSGWLARRKPGPTA